MAKTHLVSVVVFLVCALALIACGGGSEGVESPLAGSAGSVGGGSAGSAPIAHGGAAVMATEGGSAGDDSTEAGAAGSVADAGEGGAVEPGAAGAGGAAEPVTGGTGGTGGSAEPAREPGQIWGFCSTDAADFKQCDKTEWAGGTDTHAVGWVFHTVLCMEHRCQPLCWESDFSGGFGPSEWATNRCAEIGGVCTEFDSISTPSCVPR